MEEELLVPDLSIDDELTHFSFHKVHLQEVAKKQKLRHHNIERMSQRLN